MIQLSYSSLNILHTCPHNWLNKQMKIKAEEKPEWAQGKLCHKIIQEYLKIPLSSRPRSKEEIQLLFKKGSIDPRTKRGMLVSLPLKHIKHVFPIVEERDFDPRCKFEFIFENYKIRGFYDGRALDFSQLLEIKTSFKPWSLGQFQKAMQRKLYGLSDKRFKEAVLITGQRDPELWKNDPPKVYKVPFTEKDWHEANLWILEGIKILEKGDFTSDLVDGKCIDRWCYWGANCQFK